MQETTQASTSRKQAHVEACLQYDVEFTENLSGFAGIEFVHRALPEIDISDVNCSVDFLGRRLEMPFLISSMTGGYANATRINAGLAEAATETGIAMGVGSQRQLLTSDTNIQTFRAARTAGSNILLLANIGAPEIVSKENRNSIRKLIDSIEADGLIIHLNPAQEFIQPEGVPQYRGVLQGIEHLCKSLDIPVIAKETGTGICGEDTARLLQAGVSAVDVAGAGGTSWTKVELHRREERGGLDAFQEWGNPTVDCIVEAATLKSEFEFELIGSGGVQSGMDVAKCLALGADIAGAARPLLQAFMDGGTEKLVQLLQLWKQQLIGCMFLTGSEDVQQLRSAALRSPRGRWR